MFSVRAGGLKDDPVQRSCQADMLDVCADPDPWEDLIQSPAYMYICILYTIITPVEAFLISGITLGDLIFRFL